MNPSLLKSLTPFTASGLDSRGLHVWCLVLNVIYCLAAVCTISKFAIEDPWGIGWITSGALALIVYLIIGFLIQVGRNAAVENKVQAYNQSVNMVLNMMREEASLKTSCEQSKIIGTKEESNNESTTPNSEEDLSNENTSLDEINQIENIFVCDKETQKEFNKLIISIPDGTMSPVSTKALISTMKDMNKNATQNKKFLRKGDQKSILKWFAKVYGSKLSTIVLTSNYAPTDSRGEYERLKTEWRDKLEPIFAPQKMNCQGNSNL